MMPRYAIDASKIERELGWVPLETFETRFRKTYNGIWIILNGGREYYQANID